MHQADARLNRNDTAALALRDLCFAWPRARTETIRIARLDVAHGERVFLRGPSGSGKTTLLGLLGGVLQPCAGTLRVLDTDLATLRGSARDRFRADRIGFVFQQFNLLPYLGVLDNVLLGCRFSKGRAAAVGDAVAEARRCLAALGLDTDAILRAPVNELSVGQQQRVAVARALIGGPGLIICDEPTSSLDADTREAFLELLFAECGRSGATLLFVSHDPTLVHGFDRVIDLPAINAPGTRP